MSLLASIARSGGVRRCSTRFVNRPICARLPREQLGKAAAALREELIARGAARGGHFAGSLGTVELTVALHYVFETPADRLIWDVGHQAYGHKVLDGSARGALRGSAEQDGPSGFLRRSESCLRRVRRGTRGDVDLRGARHRRSAAPQGRRAQVVAVIGDGGATAGMAFEALNHAGTARSVGSGAARRLQRQRHVDRAERRRSVAQRRRARATPSRWACRMPGPIDGHDIDALLEALDRVARGARAGVAARAHAEGLRLRAGRGAIPSRGTRRRPFDIADRRAARRSAPGPPSLDRVLRGRARAHRATRSARGRDHRGDARRHGPGPLRARSSPSACTTSASPSSTRVTFAAGLAAEGLRPVCAIYSTLPAARLRSDRPRRRAPGAAGDLRDRSRGTGGCRWADAPRAARSRLPARDSAPRDRGAARRERAAAPARHGDRIGPPVRASASRAARRPAIALDPDPKPLPIGRGELLRDGRDVGARGARARRCRRLSSAAERLAELGVSVAVVDARFVKPLDVALLTELAARVRQRW